MSDGLRIDRLSFLLAVDDIVDLDSIHFRQGRGELVLSTRIFREDWLKLEVLCSGHKACQLSHDRHQIVRRVCWVVLKCWSPQIVIALDWVEDVNRQVKWRCCNLWRIVLWHVVINRRQLHEIFSSDVLAVTKRPSCLCEAPQEVDGQRFGQVEVKSLENFLLHLKDLLLAVSVVWT